MVSSWVTLVVASLKAQAPAIPNLPHLREIYNIFNLTRDNSRGKAKRSGPH